jgi:hypothetical protein
LKVLEKKSVEPLKASGARMSGGSKRPSGMNFLSTKYAKLSKGIMPRAIASVAATRIMPETRGPENFLKALGSRANNGGSSYRATPGTKKAAPSTKKCIVPAIGALAGISSDGTQESSPHYQAPEVQSKAGPCG